MKNSNKYFIRGIGIGIILSVCAFYFISIFTPKQNIKNTESINNNQTFENSTNTNENNSNNAENNYTDKISNESNKNNYNKPLTKTTKNNRNESLTENNSDEKSNIPADTNLNVDLTNNKELVKVVISYGLESFDIAELLHSLNLIDNTYNFNSYCITKKRAKYLQCGTFFIPNGSTYDEILDILTQKNN